MVKRRWYGSLVKQGTPAGVMCSRLAGRQLSTGVHGAYV